MSSKDEKPTSQDRVSKIVSDYLSEIIIRAHTVLKASIANSEQAVAACEALENDLRLNQDGQNTELLAAMGKRLTRDCLLGMTSHISGMVLTAVDAYVEPERAKFVKPIVKRVVWQPFDRTLTRLNTVM